MTSPLRDTTVWRFKVVKGKGYACFLQANQTRAKHNNVENAKRKHFFDTRRRAFSAVSGLMFSPRLLVVGKLEYTAKTTFGLSQHAVLTQRA